MGENSDDDAEAPVESEVEAPAENVSDRFDRLPATAEERRVEGRPTREEILEWWDERFGVDPPTASTCAGTAPAASPVGVAVASPVIPRVPRRAA